MKARLAQIGAHARRESGFTLIELMVAASLMIVVLTATLNALDRTTKIQRRTEKSNDTQEVIRVAMDRMAAQLRNLASPNASTLKTIDKATSYDLVFQTTDPNKRWVRYCLDDGTNSPASFTGYVASTAANERIWYQAPNNAFLAANQVPSEVGGMTGTCPAAPAASGTPGWGTAEIVAKNITNKNGADRPLFANNMAGSDTSTITNLRADVYGLFGSGVNDPKEARISTGVYLRNQNQVPTASIQTQRGAGANVRTYTLNGTTSSDPEGRTLDFLWYKATPADTATATVAKLPSCATNDPADQTKQTGGETWTCIGGGAVLDYTFPATDTSNHMAVALKVSDPGGLVGLATVNNLPLCATTTCA